MALLAFPRRYREERGDEIVATILEGGDGRHPRLRELLGLFWAGIGQRGLRASGERAVGSVRAGLRLGAFLLLWVEAVFAVTQALDQFFATRISVAGGQRFEIIGIAVTSLLGLAALSRGWWTASLGFAVTWLIAYHLFFNSFLPWPWYWMLVSEGLGLLPALLCVLARPRGREPRDLRSPLWAIAALVLGALMAWRATSWLEWQWLLAIPPVAWLVLGWRDLRLAIAAATVVTFVGLEIVFTTVLDGSTMAWNAPVRLVAYAFLLGAAVSAGMGFGARRVNA
jgi:hypothetical protein